VRVSLAPGVETATSLQKMPVRDAPQGGGGWRQKTDPHRAFDASNGTLTARLPQFLDLFD
jgi:hypothetical protein